MARVQAGQDQPSLVLSEQDRPGTYSHEAYIPEVGWQGSGTR